MGRFTPIVIRKFKPEDQVQVKNLILNGLVEHWGFLDSTKNSDLEDIVSSYQTATFLVAVLGEVIVGCGALVPVSETSGKIVRMSTDGSHRRQGIGTLVLNGLISAAKEQDFERIFLETTSTWEEVITFYLKNGFKITHIQGGDTYFTREL
jgi:putative acetyltransferase